MVGESGSGKTNAFLNVINHEPDNNIYKNIEEYNPNKKLLMI